MTAHFLNLKEVSSRITNSHEFADVVDAGRELDLELFSLVTSITSTCFVLQSLPLLSLLYADGSGIVLGVQLGYDDLSGVVGGDPVWLPTVFNDVVHEPSELLRIPLELGLLFM